MTEKIIDAIIEMKPFMNDSSTSEPSIKELVTRYYLQYNGHSKTKELVEKYFKMIKENVHHYVE